MLIRSSRFHGASNTSGLPLVGIGSRCHGRCCVLLTGLEWSRRKPGTGTGNAVSALEESGLCLGVGLWNCFPEERLVLCYTLLLGFHKECLLISHVAIIQNAFSLRPWSKKVNIERIYFSKHLKGTCCAVFCCVYIYWALFILMVMQLVIHWKKAKVCVIWSLRPIVLIDYGLPGIRRALLFQNYSWQVLSIIMKYSWQALPLLPGLRGF